jgi:hypothetical protein
VRLSEDLINDVLRVFATISEGPAVGSYDEEGDVWRRVAISGVEKRVLWFLSSLVGRFENQSSSTLAHRMRQCRLSKRRLELARKWPYRLVLSAEIHTLTSRGS